MHSIHSPDSHATMDEMCEAAIDAGLRGICFTEHVDLDPHYYSYGSYDYAETMKDTARCREKYGDRLLIMAGVEITYINGVSYKNLRAHETPEHLVCRLLLGKKKNDTWGRRWFHDCGQDDRV